jgi:hypothetical protein
VGFEEELMKTDSKTAAENIVRILREGKNKQNETAF